VLCSHARPSEGDVTNSWEWRSSPVVQLPRRGLIVKDIEAAEHVTFGGYRRDVDKLLRSATIGVIASTGWDSFTMSALEMAASGLPLVVSDLQGLSETVEHGVTGFKFTVGESKELASKLETLLSNTETLMAMSLASRHRVEQRFGSEQQLNGLCESLRDS